MKHLSCITIATLILATPLAALAQNGKPLQPNEHQTNLPGITTIETPPASLDTCIGSEFAITAFRRPNRTPNPKRMPRGCGP
jgi:hypothetical protein